VAGRIIVLIFASLLTLTPPAAGAGEKDEPKRPDVLAAGGWAGPVWSGRAGQTSHDAGRQRESADVNALTGRR
jgi:hypothetical protein